MNHNYKSPCSFCAMLYLCGVIIAGLGVLAYAMPQLGQFCGGALAIGAFIVALAWALRRK